MSIIEELQHELAHIDGPTNEQLEHVIADERRLIGGYDNRGKAFASISALATVTLVGIAAAASFGVATAPVALLIGAASGVTAVVAGKRAVLENEKQENVTDNTNTKLRFLQELCHAYPEPEDMALNDLAALAMMKDDEIGVLPNWMQAEAFRAQSMIMFHEIVAHNEDQIPGALDQVKQSFHALEDFNDKDHENLRNSAKQIRDEIASHENGAQYLAFEKIETEQERLNNLRDTTRETLEENKTLELGDSEMVLTLIGMDYADDGKLEPALKSQTKAQLKLLTTLAVDVVSEISGTFESLFNTVTAVRSNFFGESKSIGDLEQTDIDDMYTKNASNALKEAHDMLLARVEHEARAPKVVEADIRPST